MLEYFDTFIIRKHGGEGSSIAGIKKAALHVTMKKRQGKKRITYRLTRVFFLTTVLENCLDTT